MKTKLTPKHMIPLLLCLIIFSSISGCLSKQTIPGTSTPDTLVVGASDPIFGFHPWIKSYDVATISINHNIFNSLVGFDDNYRIIPELAETWTNPDNLTWRFQLRQNIYFHNNDTLTVEDVKYSIDIILKDNTSVFHDLLFNIRETPPIQLRGKRYVLF